MIEGNNLLVRLHRWVHRQDENYTTEALVHLLQHLLDHEPVAAAAFLTFMTGDVVDLATEEIRIVRLATQVTTDAGRPDVEIRTIRHRVFLEAKVEAGVGKQQLEKYRSELDTCGVERTALVLLTRYPAPAENVGGDPNKCVRWYQIADWLAEHPAVNTIQHAVSRHMVGQFLGFLSARGMTMEQVGWEMVPGVRELCNFLALLAEAAAACHLSVKPRSVLPEFIGLHMANKRYWIGIGCDDPGVLWSQTNAVRIDVHTATNLGKGEVWPESWAPSKHVWGLSLDLRAEEVHFFARSRASQMQRLEKFIQEFLDAAQRIELPDQVPPPTSEPDDEEPAPLAAKKKGK